jgi:TusA-related sulfurtransferase
MDNNSDTKMSAAADYFLDITTDVCPMTFVRTRLLIEKMKPGETAEIRLTGGEPLENVPESVAELGHQVLEIAREEGSPDPGLHRIRIRKV